MGADTDSIGRSTMRRRWTALAVMVALSAAAVLVPTSAQATAPSADLSVAISHAPAAIATLDHVTFTLTATNAGPDPAQGVVVGLSFAYPLQPISADSICSQSYGGYNSNTSVLCYIGTVASGASASATIVL